MITKHDIIEFMKKQGDDFSYIYVEGNDSIYSKNGEWISSLDEFLNAYRKNIGQSFECIYSDDLSLCTILRCTECGTVIKSYDDERYDFHLCCPTCTDYKTYFEFWTKEEIESDENKQKEIDWLMDLSKRKKELDERIKRRNGKYDWQIISKTFYGKKIYIGIFLDCNDITESYFKGLKLKLHFAKKIKGENGYSRTKCINIPLCWSEFYYRFIYKHLGKCHPDFRSKWYIGKPYELREENILK